jgi:peptide deformylase
MILKIIHYPHSLLKYKTKEVTNWNQDLHDFIESLITTMRAFDGIGLAANQVGVPKQILIFDYLQVNAEDWVQTTESTKEQAKILINPKMISFENPFLFEGDACLSFPGVVLDTIRYHNCEVSYQNISGERHSLKASGLAAVEIQHELDHLNGQMFIERSEEQISEKQIIQVIKKSTSKSSYLNLQKKLKAKTWPKEKLTF